VLYYERKLYSQGFDTIIGVDEAGRGPLAGPVVAAAVVLKKNRFDARIDDSKKLSPRQREEAFPEILNNSIFGLGIISESIIDRVNILNATRMAMQKAIEQLLENLGPGLDKSRVHIIVDGKMRLELDYPCTDIIKGDGKSLSIASASILAKVTRDRLMVECDRLFPGYGFKQHKGYGTPGHLKAIKKLGLSSVHRKSFYSQQA
jgi:ribonuclease HII